MPRKSTCMDATVARGFMPDGTVMILPTLWGLSHSVALSGRSNDNLICDFIPVLEITSRL